MWPPYGRLLGVNPRDRKIAEARAVLAGGSACAQVLAGMHGSRPWQVMLMITTGVLAAGALWPQKNVALQGERVDVQKNAPYFSKKVDTPSGFWLT